MPLTSISHMRRFLLLTSLFFLGIHSAYSQLFSVTLAATPTNKTCYSGSLSASYVATISPPKGYVYGTDYTYISSTFDLRTSLNHPAGTIVTTNTGGTATATTISGSFSSIASTNDYTITATIIINNIRLSTSQTIQTTSSFIVGYESTWADALDMQSLPNNFSCKRAFTTSGVTYARGISANLLAASTDGWIDVGAQFAGTTGSVFVVFGKTTTSDTDPTTQPNSIEFRKTSASTGTVIIKSGGTSTIVSGIAFTDRVFVRRASGVIKFYKEGANAVVSGAPTITYTTPLNIGVFAANVGDGISSALTSFSCVFENQYYYLKDDIEQTVAYVSAADTKLRFKYNEEYFDASGTLNYSIKCLTDDVVPTTVTITKPKHTNWIEIPFGTGGIAYTAGNTYLLTVLDSKGRKQYLKFKKL